MEVVSYLLMFGFGILLLVCGSSLLVESAVSLAARLRLPEIFIGVTLVSLCTTLPEAVFATMSAARGLPDMALGNALGAALCNLGFIAGIFLLLRPMKPDRFEVRNIRAGLCFMAAALAVYAGSAAAFGGLSKETAAVLLALAALFLGNAFRSTWTYRNAFLKREKSGKRLAGSESLWEIGRMLLEVVVIYIGAGFLTEYGPKLAECLGVPDSLISLTLVTVGTSLPELVATLLAWRKGHASLSLGNIIGASLLNLTLAGGLSALIRPISWESGALRLELPLLLAMTGILCVPAIAGKRMGRLQGAALAALYMGYLWTVL